jgi:hypothetical protein
MAHLYSLISSNAIAAHFQMKFSARRGTMMEGLRTPMEVVVTVVILLSHGCPLQAIVQAYGMDESTVADLQKRAGKHSQ